MNLNYFNASTTLTLHARRYTRGVLKGSWRGCVKITHRATVDGKEHVKREYRWTPDYMGHETREKAIAAAQIIKDRML